MSKRIRVALITTNIDNRRARGTSLVSRRFLERISSFSSEFEFTLIHEIKTDDPIYNKYPELLMRRFHLPFASAMISETWFWLKHRLCDKRFDVVHYLQPRVWPSYLLANAKHVVITPHDAGIMLNLHPMGIGEYLFKFTNRFLHQRMHALVAVSSYARDEIVRYFRIDPKRVHVVYNGIDPGFKKVEVTRSVRERLEGVYKIKTPYILSVGRLEPHKNVLNLLEAYAELVSKGCSEYLVIVGGRHLPEYSNEVEKRIKKLNLNERVLIAPFIEEADLPAVYSAASVLAYVSLHEGFGLPVLEAYACGVPVVISNNTSLPEIANNGAVVCDPFDFHSISFALNKVLKDGMLRSNCVEKGFCRVSDFSWDKMTREIVEIYKNLHKL